MLHFLFTVLDFLFLEYTPNNIKTQLFPKYVF